jgi:hypothetical protein
MGASPSCAGASAVSAARGPFFRGREPSCNERRIEFARIDEPAAFVFDGARKSAALRTPAQRAGRRSVALGGFVQRQPLGRTKLVANEVGGSTCNRFEQVRRDRDSKLVAHARRLAF